MKPPTRRDLKNLALEILRGGNHRKAVAQLSEIPLAKGINTLFHFLYHGEDTVRWTAVSTLGVLVSRLAHEDLEAARTILRRLMWNLNDESGGIGWGSPEAMGEILANHEALAGEFSHILISYAREEGNYLEEERLQRGLLWGIGRLAQVRPHLLEQAKGLLPPYLRSCDPYVRGHAAWAIGLIGDHQARKSLEGILSDRGLITIYVNHELMRRLVKDLAREALEKLVAGKGPP